ncbi:MAG TPA: hypothetical protein VHB77_13655, partial [Planctomycetaceae bacterium]|nr:hypothetical protein [Planctomycetaceae bacterium]
MDSADAQPALEVKLSIDRQGLYAGEAIQLRGAFRNASTDALKLPRVDFARQFAFVHLHVTTPADQEFIYQPYAGNPLRSSLTSLTPRSFSIELAPDAERDAFRQWLRLSEGQRGWGRKDGSEASLSLRTSGEYRVWLEYIVPMVANAPPEAWMGSVRSNIVTFTVSELPAEDRQLDLTEEQRGALEALQSVPPTSIEGRDVLQAAMMRAPNEPLAERLVELCRQNSHRSNDFMAMLGARACNPHREPGPVAAMQLGIDGPYLRTAALSTLAAYEADAEEPNVLRPFRSDYGINLAIAYARFHPENRDVHERLLKLALRDAPLPPPQSREITAKGPGHASRRTGIGTVMAWNVLLELGVLRTGMSTDDATRILGPPSRRNG